MDVVVRFLLVVAFAAFVAAPRAAAQTDAGTAAYRTGDLAGARQAWTAELDASKSLAGDERARVLYDLGNVAFREGQVLESVGWYTASLRLRPRDADAWANLEHARRVAKLEPADRGDLRATIRRVLGAFTPDEARWLALGGMLACAATLAFEALRGGRGARWLAFGGAAFALLLAAPWIHGAWTDVERPALVIENRVDVRSEPRKDASTVAFAEAGALVEHVDALPGWEKIRLADGTEGWANDAAVFDLAR